MSDDIEFIVDQSIETAPRIALVQADGLEVRSRTEAGPALRELLARVQETGEAWFSSSRKAAVRDMLRHGVYKPAGRAKPSSEYLLASAVAKDFPVVNGPVDANNAASLAYGYPASIFDAGKIGKGLLLRRGAAGESYVFNASGQEIDLEDLLCLWRREGQDWKPVGNPVKDAMETKVFEGCRSIMAVVYAPPGGEGGDLEACAEYYAELLRSDCGAERSSWRVY